MSIYQYTGALSPARSMFNLSYSKMLTCDMGQLIPVICDEAVPGDIWQISSEAVLRMQPLVAPVMHEINVYLHLYFVPYRILWPKNEAETDGWEIFITGGQTGDLEPVQPVWQPTTDSEMAVGSLWDYLGFPTGLTAAGMQGPFPVDYPRRAYNLVWNEFYRDENLQNKRLLSDTTIALRAWEKDYFTSALPWQQRGTAPALPVTGTSKAIWPNADFVNYPTGVNAQGFRSEAGVSNKTFNAGSAQGIVNAQAFFADNTVDLSSATTFDVSDLRQVVQIQKWMERSARGGVRYTEFLRSMFGVSPRDDRLQRPEYFGGSKSPVIVSEVLQTSSSDVTTPQGNMAGHGIAVQAMYGGKYHCQEYGLILGLMSILPRPMYQQGINRQWLRPTRYDYYFREFANLSEQAIERAEIYYSGVEAENKTLFGFQGRYNEMRQKDNMVTSQMRSIFDYWHLGREFSSAPALNSTFITCVPRKDIFAVPSVPGFLINWGNRIKALRPMPVEPVPGLMDHF